MIELFNIAVRSVPITICLLLLLATFQRYKSSHLYTYKTISLSIDRHTFQKAIHRIRSVPITICLLLLLETFQRYTSSHLYTYKSRSLSMDRHTFQKEIHRIKFIQPKVHSVILLY